MKAPQNLHSKSNLLWDRGTTVPTLWEDTEGKRYDLAAWQETFGNDLNSIVAAPESEVLADPDSRLTVDISTYCLERLFADSNDAPSALNERS